jgi:hypothetical protein
LLPSLDTGTKWNNHHFSQSQNVAKKAATPDKQGNHQKDRIIKDVILSFVSFRVSPTYLLEFHRSFFRWDPISSTKWQMAHPNDKSSCAQDFLAIHASVPMMLTNHFVSNLIHTRTTEKNDENDAEQNKVLKDSSPNALISDPLSFC